MLQSAEEKVNALTKLADLIGKKTLVMWSIVTTFTTGYLFIDGRKTQESRINEIKESNERLIKEIKEIKENAKEATIKIDETKQNVDTTIINIKKTLNKINDN